MNERKTEKIEISYRTIIFTVLFLVALWFLYYIKDIILQLFVALVLMSILNPTVESLTKHKIPRALSILLVYLVMLSILGVTIAALVPTLINQTTKFVGSIPKYLDNLGIFGTYTEQVIGQAIAQVGAFPSQLAKVIVSLFSNVFSVVAVLIFSFYLLLSREKLEHQYEYLFGKERSVEIHRILIRMEGKLGNWARGQLALMFLVWSSTYIGLFLLGIPFALPLSILAGLLEIIPIIGPFISAVPAVIVALSISPILGIATTSLYFLIQQLENYIFVPKVMEKSAGVTPMVTLIALAVGLKVSGVVGALISIPVVITIKVLFKEYLLSGKK